VVIEHEGPAQRPHKEPDHPEDVRWVARLYGVHPAAQHQAEQPGGDGDQRPGEFGREGEQARPGQRLGKGADRGGRGAGQHREPPWTARADHRGAISGGLQRLAFPDHPAVSLGRQIDHHNDHVRASIGHL